MNPGMWKDSNYASSKFYSLVINHDVRVGVGAIRETGLQLFFPQTLQ